MALNHSKPVILYIQQLLEAEKRAGSYYFKVFPLKQQQIICGTIISVETVNTGYSEKFVVNVTDGTGTIRCMFDAKEYKAQVNKAIQNVEETRQLYLTYKNNDKTKTLYREAVRNYGKLIGNRNNLVIGNFIKVEGKLRTSNTIAGRHPKYEGNYIFGVSFTVFRSEKDVVEFYQFLNEFYAQRLLSL